MLHNSPDLIEAFLRLAKSEASTAAVDEGGSSVTYRELSLRAYKIAGLIQRAKLGPSPRVLLALTSSSWAYAAMIGSLMAGGTFCPIHLAGPEGRITAICRTFAPDLILYAGTPPTFLDTLPLTTRRIDVLQPGTTFSDSPAVERSEVAYVVFTSGSTGNPKGVKLGRLGFSYFLDIAQGYFNLHPGERWGQFTNLGHDLGVMDVFMALTHGGTLVPLNEAECLRPAVAISSRRISVWQSVPSVIELMLRANQVTAKHLATLRVMSFCGEPLRPQQLAHLFNARPDLQVFNTYGATETTGFNTINKVTATNYSLSCDAGDVAIGDPVLGWNVHLLGGDTRDEGEIVIASEYLSLGYWQDEGLTSAAFRQVQFGTSGSQRCYFTGDRGIRKGARLYCLGRTDRQVKIRGERIELDEIDVQLRDAGFPAAYTILKDGELYSFVESSEELDQERIRARLRKALPFHSIPKTIQSLPSLPRNANGKIDREALARKAAS